MTRKRWTLVGLVGVLVLWIVLQTMHSLDEEELYNRQMVTVTSVVLVDPVDGVAVERDVEALLQPALRQLASCLKTPSGSRAPITIQATLQPTSRPDGSAVTPAPDAPTAGGVAFTYQAEGGIDADAEQCLDDTLVELAWQSLQLDHGTLYVTLTPLADALDQ